MMKNKKEDVPAMSGVDDPPPSTDTQLTKEERKAQRQAQRLERAREERQRQRAQQQGVVRSSSSSRGGSPRYGVSGSRRKLLTYAPSYSFKNACDRANSGECKGFNAIIRQTHQMIERLKNIEVTALQEKTNQAYCDRHQRLPARYFSCMEKNNEDTDVCGPKYRQWVSTNNQNHWGLIDQFIGAARFNIAELRKYTKKFTSCDWSELWHGEIKKTPNKNPTRRALIGDAGSIDQGDAEWSMDSGEIDLAAWLSAADQQQ